MRGYVSRLDGSVQPYGLVVPESYAKDGQRKYRLDFWFHGRGETLSEVNFLRDREKNVGTFAPPDAIVLHPYGRYCNANKFAGEVDALEALDSVRRRYPIDDDRIVVRGFSMGGASTWHLAVHYPEPLGGRQSGCGFRRDAAVCERLSQGVSHAHLVGSEALSPLRLHRLGRQPAALSDGRLFGRNRFAEAGGRRHGRGDGKTGTASGPRDRAENEARLRAARADEVERRISALAAKGREHDPQTVHFTTYTLKYNNCAWITVDALDRHWERARIEAHRETDGSYTISAENVKAFTIDLPSGETAGPVKVKIGRWQQCRDDGDRRREQTLDRLVPPRRRER